MTSECIASNAIQCEVKQARSRGKLFGSRLFRKRLLDALHLIVERHQIRLLSLDLFDTVLLRDQRSELRRFWEIAGQISRRLNREAGIAVNPECVLVARLTAARAAYRSTDAVDGCREGDLDSIYRIAGHLLGVPPAHVGTLIEIEMAFERGCLLANPAIVDVAERFARDGVKTIVLSDVYIEADRLNELLADCGVPRTLFAEVISSADTRISKRSGRLFDWVASRFDVRPEQCLHVGDSLISDYVRPRQAGWRSFHLPVPLVERQAWRDDHFRVLAALEERSLTLGSIAPAAPE